MKLNLGCGPSGLNTWINYDWGILALLSKFPFLRKFLIFFKVYPKDYDLPWPKIKLVDIRKKLPLEEKSVKYIYCSHVIEHFEFWQALLILKECRRVIENDGLIRIIVPDIEKLIGIYRRNLEKEFPRPAQQFCRYWWGYDKDKIPENFWEKINRIFIRDHKWHYDQKEMVFILKQAGFSKIKILSFQEGKTPDIDKLDLPEQQNHSLYIEASV